MKISKTTPKSDSAAVRTTRPKKSGGTPVAPTDSVELSAEVHAAAPVAQVAGVEEGALPDAYETSDAMLRKEVRRIWRLDIP